MTVVDTLPQAVYLKDYKTSVYCIDQVELRFELGGCLTTVKSKLQVRRLVDELLPLVLDGEQMRLIELAVDGTALMPDQFKLDEVSLTIYELPKACLIEIEVEINPGANKALSGLYVSNGNYCSQCESHGFRHITYFLDRPDVMTRFTTTITADSVSFPYLLSNGNCIDRGDLPGGRHWVKWHDPSLKPCYLFALVAGNFEELTDEFKTCTGRAVNLAVYVEQGKGDQARFAMSALKKSMRWDEDTYQREYELDIYMIVAVGDFNFGAMENKGLNIFNDRYILAKSESATDHDFLGVDIVIAHEYFHNWSGNRVTCRDWFQLSLKEGLTVFREQKYTAFVWEEAVARICQAKEIQTAQFKEDSGPMAHPVRPPYYIDMNNFYTVTVYSKGAEVIRMIETLITEPVFKKALNEYFARFDGMAVTTDDFVDVMQEVSGVDLTQFRYWYDQAGTPDVHLSSEYNAQASSLQLTFTQKTLPTFGQPDKKDLHIPILFTLLDESGVVIVPKQQQGIHIDDQGQSLFALTKNRETLTLEGIKSQPMVSCLERFSSPVRLHYDLELDQRLFLVRHADDGYQCWYQLDQVYINIIKTLLACDHEDKFPCLPDLLVETYQEFLANEALSPALIAEVLDMPSDSYILQIIPGTDISKLTSAMKYLRRSLAQRCYDGFMECYQRLEPIVPYQYNTDEMAKRSLRNLCLAMLNLSESADAVNLAMTQFKLSDNMTDTMGAMNALSKQMTPKLDEVLQTFYDRWQNDALVIDKWFALQAMSSADDVLERVRKLTQHEAFDIQNPNRVRSLIGTFVNANLAGFHREDGQGYAFLTKKFIQIQDLNPQLAARIITPFLYWKRFDEHRQNLILAQLKQIRDYEKLKKNVFELVSRALADAPVDEETAESEK